jgi:hypothetical protein
MLQMKHAATGNKTETQYSKTRHSTCIYIVCLMTRNWSHNLLNNTFDFIAQMNNLIYI